METITLSSKLAEMKFLSQYSLGARQFQQAQLRNINLGKQLLDRVDLIKSDLDNANFEKAQLNDSDFRKSNLINANFKFSEIDRVNFEGANLQNAKFSLAKLTEVDFTGACLKHASLYAATLNEVNFSFADLRGAYLSGIDLSNVNLKGAFYSRTTMFPPGGFNPSDAGMIDESDIESLEILISQFDRLYKCSEKYLGNVMSAKYFHSSRPDFDWLNKFEIDKLNQIAFSEVLVDSVSPLQFYWFQQWMSSFTKSCSKIIKNFQNMI